jgi:hypothetical protein
VTPVTNVDQFSAGDGSVCRADGFAQEESVAAWLCASDGGLIQEWIYLFVADELAHLVGTLVVCLCVELVEEKVIEKLLELRGVDSPAPLLVLRPRSNGLGLIG